MKAGEGQLHLGLHPRRPDQPQIRCRPGRVLQQLGLADPRLAPHHQRPPASGAHILDQAVQRLPLPLPVYQRGGRV